MPKEVKKPPLLRRRKKGEIQYLIPREKIGGLDLEGRELIYRILLLKIGRMVAEESSPLAIDFLIIIRLSAEPKSEKGLDCERTFFSITPRSKGMKDLVRDPWNLHLSCLKESPFYSCSWNANQELVEGRW